MPQTTPTAELPTAERALLGRDEELVRLLEHLGIGGAPAGGSAALVAGDAGMGKTSVVLKLTDTARTAGWRLMVGHCLDFADLSLPYLPFSEMVGRLADEDPDAARQAAQAHPALAALAPGRRLMSDPVVHQQVDQAELFEAMHATLEALAEHGPVLVVVEDLHWADQSTRDLLRFLLARPYRGPVALVGSYRSDDLHRRHPLRAAVAECARLPQVLRMQLPPLPDAVVRRLVHSLHQGSLSERDLAAIVGRAEGNPFFVEELLDAVQLDGGRARIPEDLAELLLVRLDRLDEDAGLVVRAASCSGRRVSHRLLAAVAVLPDEALEQAVRSAVDSNVLVRVGGDGYAFRHALLAEAVYDDLLPGERIRLHGRYVDALAGQVVEGTAAELATHARAALDVRTAIHAGIRAAEEAMAVGGPEDAAKHFEAVLELLARPGAEPAEDTDVPALVSRAADAFVASGQPGRAMALVRDHLDQAGTTLSNRGRGRLLLAWAAAALVNESADDPVEESAEALALVGEEPSRLRTKGLSLHARALAGADRPDEAAKYAGEAIAMAQRFDLPRVAAEAATTLATLDVESGDFDAAAAALDRVVTNARSAEDPFGELRGRYHLAHIHLETGRLEVAQELFRLTAAAAAEAGQPWAPYGFDARYMEAMTAYLRGGWDDALRIADFAGQRPPIDAEALLLTVGMLVGAGRGDESVLRHYDALRSSWQREGMVAISAGATAIDLYGARGDLDSLWHAYDEVVTCLSRTWGPLFQARVRLSALALGHLADAAPRLTGRARAAACERAAAVTDVVTQIERRTEARRRGSGPEGHAWLGRVRAEHLRLRWLLGDEVSQPDLVHSWERVVELFDRFGQPHEAARSRVRLAGVLLRGGRTAEAAPLLDEARPIAVGLGAEPLLTELEGLAAPAPVRTATAARATTAELTRREAEILELVALGRTNGQIARELFISAKTVSVHVSNILAKLGASGRTEAAAIAHRRGLLGA